MTFVITKKTKAALNAKTKARKKHLDGKVSLAAIAASSPENLLAEMKLEVRPIKSLKGLKRRVRKSEQAQVERIAKSLRTFRQSAPIVINGSGEIIDGHLVVKALESLGQTDVMCAVIDHLDEHERELLHITLNRIAECGDWDVAALGSLLIELDEIGFDLEITGFTVPEIDILTMPDLADDGDSEEAAFEPPEGPVSVPGDVWVLGRHRLLCADATDPKSYAVLLDGKLVAVVFTDCPWNIPIAGFVSGLGKKKHQDFKMAAGEMSGAEFMAFCNCFHLLAADHLIEGGVFFSFIDWRSIDVVMAAGRNADLTHINTAVWNKGAGGMGALYRSAHELVVIFRKGAKVAVNNVELGKHGRDRTNVWSYPGANRPGSSASEALAYHPTGKPIPLVEDALKDVSRRGDAVLDPFMGSGTTLLAAEGASRVAYGIEIDPAYVDVTVRRWEAMTGKTAVHEPTGLSFLEIETQRSSQGDEPLAA